MALYNLGVHIEASAPTRIDLAGGTLDIWPLYLFHDGAQTLNAAISLRAHGARSRSRSDGTHRHRLGGRAIAGRGRSLVARCASITTCGCSAGCSTSSRSAASSCARDRESPVGAGIAGSSALNIAVCGALNAWTGGVADGRGAVPGRHERRGAGDRRADGRAGLPARRSTAASRPSSSASTACAGSALHVTRTSLQQRLALAYTNASRNSGHQQLGRHEAAHRRRSPGAGQLRENPRHRRRDARGARRGRTGRRSAVRSPPEWENRKQLAPGVTTPEIDAMLAAAAGAGALGRQGLRRRRRRLPVLFRRPRDASPAIRRGARPTPARGCWISRSRSGADRREIERAYHDSRRSAVHGQPRHRSRPHRDRRPSRDQGREPVQDSRISQRG